MPIVLTVREATAAFRAIEKLPTLKDGKATYSLAYIANKLEAGISLFERERERMQRDISIIETFKDDKGVEQKRQIIPIEKLDDYARKIDEMLETTITIDRDPVTYNAAFPPPPPGLPPEGVTKYEEKYPRPTAAEIRPLTKIIVD